MVGDFGYVPDKAVRKSAQTKKIAVEKAAATRLARKTMGKKQRLKVKAATKES